MDGGDIDKGVFGNGLNDEQKAALMAKGVPDNKHDDFCWNGDDCQSNDFIGANAGNSVSLFKCHYCFHVECARCSGLP